MAIVNDIAVAYHGVRNLSFCSLFPYLYTGAQYSELWALMMTPVEAQTRLTSSIAMAYDTASISAPPNSEDTLIPIIPSSPSFLTCGAGK